MTSLPLMAVHDVFEGTVIGRLNRFVVEVRSGSRRLCASINNTGGLLDFLTPGRKAFLLPHLKHLKTDCSLFAVEESMGAALIDTQLQMRAFESALRAQRIDWLGDHCIVARNARLGRSVVDYLLRSDDGEAYLEVKSAVLKEGKYAMYPDCPTAGGRRHVAELTGHVGRGGRAYILLTAALPGGAAFKPSATRDPELCRLLAAAQRSGVALKAINIMYDPRESCVHMADANFPVEFERLSEEGHGVLAPERHTALH